MVKHKIVVLPIIALFAASLVGCEETESQKVLNNRHYRSCIEQQTRLGDLSKTAIESCKSYAAEMSR